MSMNTNWVYLVAFFLTLFAISFGKFVYLNQFFNQVRMHVYSCVYAFRCL